MSFKPRYSLLTLLVLTALVAGGVKWWYGPHHVVEPSGPDEEAEYTFTRDWQGNRIIHGIRVERSHGDDYEYVVVRYYRHGMQLPRAYIGVVAPSDGRTNLGLRQRDRIFNDQMTEQENQEWQAAIDREWPQTIKPGFKHIVYDGDYGQMVRKIRTSNQ